MTEQQPEDVPVLPPQEVRAVLEALIFASPQPVTPQDIAQAMGGVPREAWQQALGELQADYARDGRGLQLVEVAGGWQITTCSTPGPRRGCPSRPWRRWPSSPTSSR
jgi:chromosome segregation and condensation protein ScpB